MAVFLDIQTVSSASSDKDWVIYMLLGLIAILFMAGVGLFTWGVNSFSKRMERQEDILNTYMPKFAEHDVEIRNLKERVTENEKWTNHHDHRIQTIESKLR